MMGDGRRGWLREMRSPVARIRVRAACRRGVRIYLSRLWVGWAMRHSWGKR
jgi:hypothetical protein